MQSQQVIKVFLMFWCLIKIFLCNIHVVAQKQSTLGITSDLEQPVLSRSPSPSASFNSTPPSEHSMIGDPGTIIY